MHRRTRVLIASPGLDDQERGARVVCRALRDAGMEVIYAGTHQTPEQVVSSALQEDVDGVGLATTSGNHRELFASVLRLLREGGADDMVLFGGGFVPSADIGDLEAMGVTKVFPTETRSSEIVDWVREALGADETAGALPRSVPGA